MCLNKKIILSLLMMNFATSSYGANFSSDFENMSSQQQMPFFNQPIHSWPFSNLCPVEIKLNLDLSGIVEQTQNKTKEIQEKSILLSKAQTKINNLTANLKKIDGDLLRLLGNNALCEKLSIQKKINRVASNIKDLNGHIDALSKESQLKIQELEDHKTKIQKDIDQKTQEINNLQAHDQVDEGKINELQANIGELNNQIMAKETEIGVEKTALEEATRGREVLEQENKDLAERYNALVDKNGDLNTQLSNKDKDLEEIDSDLLRLLGNNALCEKLSIQEKINRVASNIKDLNGHIDALSKESQLKIQKLEDDKAKIQEDIDQKTQQLDYLRAHNQVDDSEINELQANIGELNSLITKKDGEIDAERKALTNAVNNQQTLEQENKDLKASIQNLEKKNSALETAFQKEIDSINIVLHNDFNEYYNYYYTFPVLKKAIECSTGYRQSSNKSEVDKIVKKWSQGKLSYTMYNLLVHVEDTIKYNGSSALEMKALEDLKNILVDIRCKKM